MTDIETCIANADAHLKQNEFRKALSLLERAKLMCGEDNPLHKAVLKKMAEAYTMIGDEAKAEIIEDRIREPEPTFRERFGQHPTVVWFNARVAWLAERKIKILFLLALVAVLLGLRPELKAASYWVRYSWSVPDEALKSSIHIFTVDDPDDVALYNRYIFQYRTVFPDVVLASDKLSREVKNYDFGTKEQEGSLEIVRQLKYDKYTILLCSYKKLGLNIKKAYWLRDVGNKFYLSLPPSIPETDGPKRP